jgi:MFS family permease
MSRREMTVVILLAISGLINYIDRSNLSIAAPVLEKQLSLSPLQIGSLLAAFSWTYALLQLVGVSGWLTDRFPVSRVMLWGFVVWSVATIATGLVSGFALLFMARLLLGAGESIAYPCYSRIFADLPQEHRGRANALIDAGTKLGPTTGTLIGGFLLVHFDWRMLFIVLGVGGLAWLIPWIIFMPRTHREKDATIHEAIPSTSELLHVSAAWGAFLGHFCGNYFFYFLLAWLPYYLVREARLSLGTMVHLTSSVFFVVASSTILTGWLSDRLIARGASPTRIRKTVVVGGLSVASSLLALAFTSSDLRLSVIILFVACMGYGAYSSNHWAISQTLAGPAMAGRWTSVQNGIGNLSGIAAPWIAGAILQINGSSRVAFVVAGLVAMAGAFIWAFMVPRVEQVQWKIPVFNTATN